MTIEKNLTRIADALERIAGVLEHESSDNETVETVPPSPEIPGSAVEAAAPKVQTSAPIPPPPATETPAAAAATAPQPPVTTAPEAVTSVQLTIEQLNEALVTEFNRLGGRDGIDQVLQQNGATSISTLQPAMYNTVLAAVQALQS